MAEYCTECAKKFGFEMDETPMICEGCGKTFDDDLTIPIGTKIIVAVVALIMMALMFGF